MCVGLIKIETMNRLWSNRVHGHFPPTHTQIFILTQQAVIGAGCTAGAAARVAPWSTPG